MNERQQEQQTETEGGMQADTEREKKPWKAEERTKWGREGNRGSEVST